MSGTPPSDWESLHSASARATLFQSPRWMRVLERAFPEYQLRYLVDADPPGAVWPFAVASRMGLRETVSLPLGTHGGPVGPAAVDRAVVAAMARRFLQEARRGIPLRHEITLFDPHPHTEAGVRDAVGSGVELFHTYVVPLAKGFDWIWNTGYENDVRRCVRKAEKEGVTVSDETTPQGARLVFDLHAVQAAGWGSKALDADRLWKVAEAMGENARIWVTRRQGRALTAVLTLYDPGHTVYPWISGATEEARRVRAYHAMMNHAMREGCDRGYRWWNWGGSVGRSSVEKFKQSMAGAPVPVLRAFHEAAWLRAVRGLRNRARS